MRTLIPLLFERKAFRGLCVRPACAPRTVSLGYRSASAVGTGWRGSAGDALYRSRIATNSHHEQCTAKEQAIYLPTRQMPDGFTFDSLNSFAIRYICTIQLREAPELCH